MKSSLNCRITSGATTGSCSPCLGTASNNSSEPSATREYYLVRHYAVFVLFWLGCIAFYRLLFAQTRSWKWALLGTLLLILSPRIFAHSFYNVKDAVFLSIFLFGIWTLWRFLEKPGVATALWHALSTAVLIDTRIVGVVLPAITFGWILIYALFPQKTGQNPKRLLLLFLLYIAATGPLLTALWPYLWEAPIAHFLEAFEVMGNFNWQGQVLLWNDWLEPHKQTPWHYVPSWMLVSTPVLNTLLFLTGLGLLIGKFRLQRLADPEWRFALLGLSLYLLPLLVVIIKGSTLYDGWRQMFFLYPGFLIVALWALRVLYRREKLRRWLQGILGISLLLILIQMIRIHPHQQVYLNVLAGDYRELRFEQDYWGLSYKQALKSWFAGIPVPRSLITPPIILEQQTGSF